MVINNSYIVITNSISIYVYRESKTQCRDRSTDRSIL